RKTVSRDWLSALSGLDDAKRQPISAMRAGFGRCFPGRRLRGRAGHPPVAEVEQMGGWFAVWGGTFTRSVRNGCIRCAVLPSDPELIEKSHRDDTREQRQRADAD